MERTEQLIKAKIPGKETGIEIRRTICDICCPSFHCGIDAYVKDGRVIKVEGTKGHPMNDGLLCTKGLSNREYIYRRDRILTPLKRVGERGEGKFQEITWEEAYRICAEKLNGWKEKEGADSVLFFGGYTKWFRPWLHRLAFSFGTENYATESSTCFTSGFMAWKIATGRGAKGDMAHCGVYLGWAFNPYHSRYLNGKKADEAKARGVKFIIVDPRITPAVEKLADIHLRPRGGTDGALALAMANILIQNNWIDREYIDRYMEGFDAFAEYVSGFNESNLEAITGVPYSQAVEACRMIYENGPMAINESSAPWPTTKMGCRITGPSWPCRPSPATTTGWAASSPFSTPTSTRRPASSRRRRSSWTRFAPPTPESRWGRSGSPSGMRRSGRPRPRTWPGRFWRKSPTPSGRWWPWA